MAFATIDPLTGSTDTAAGAAKKSEAGSEDRFLKLLVAQMQNQDPLNPLDNAQVTSQMAQINTVNGVEKLNRTVQGLNTQFIQMQTLQGASLIGRDVVVPGDRLGLANDTGTGGFELQSDAQAVSVEILNASGSVIDTMDLGAQQAGRHNFDWPAAGADPQAGLRFRVLATNGAAVVPATPLMHDKVEAVNTGGDTLTLELQRSGSVPYASIKSFN
jgi:flagellar basal-body rod modification protein FlgD